MGLSVNETRLCGPSFQLLTYRWSATNMHVLLVLPG